METWTCVSLLPWLTWSCQEHWNLGKTATEWVCELCSDSFNPYKTACGKRYCTCSCWRMLELSCQLFDESCFGAEWKPSLQCFRTVVFVCLKSGWATIFQPKQLFGDLGVIRWNFNLKKCELGNFIKARIRQQSSLCFAEIKLQPSPIAAVLIGELYLVKFKLNWSFLQEVAACYWSWKREFC